MRLRTIALALLASLAVSARAGAQQQTGEIFGKVTDGSGAVLPGVAVTLTGPVLLQPLTAIASDTGTYQFPRLSIGTYTVKFDLAGFKTIVKEGILVTVGFSAQVNAQMAISSVQETVTVTGESPVVDTRNTGTKQTFTNELLQTVPSARDPWVILQQTAGIAMDRENVGGNMSGQQSNYVSRGAMTNNNKWSLDGIDITDMAATGGSPTYYDFDAFEEMTINTGGVDVTQQTGGVGINLVTKSGTDRFKGSSRYYVTDKALESQNITDAQRRQGASSGNPIQNIKDYGLEAGGPLRRGRAWMWGAIGKQTVGVGVVGFFQPTAACQAIKNPPLASSIADVNDCLNTDLTELQTTNLKAEVQLFKGNKLSLYNLFSKKVATPGTPSDLRRSNRRSVRQRCRALYGMGLAHRSEPDLQVRRPVGGERPPPARRPVRPRRQQLHPRLPRGRARGRAADVHRLDEPQRPVDARRPAVREHSPGQQREREHELLPAGHDGRRPRGQDGRLLEGREQLQLDAYARLRGRAFPDGGLERLFTGGDRLPGAGHTRRPDRIRSAERVGLRAGHVHAQPLHGADRRPLRLQPRSGAGLGRRREPAGAAAAARGYLPGADPGVAFHNVSPRLGLTYDLSGSGKTLVKANYAIYFGQVGTAGVSGQVNPVSRVSVRYPWVDLNGDRFVQANELTLANGGRNPLAVTGNWDPNIPRRSRPRTRWTRTSRTIGPTSSSSASIARSARGSPPA